MGVMRRPHNCPHHLIVDQQHLLRVPQGEAHVDLIAVVLPGGGPKRFPQVSKMFLRRSMCQDASRREVFSGSSTACPIFQHTLAISIIVNVIGR